MFPASTCVETKFYKPTVTPKKMKIDQLFPAQDTNQQQVLTGREGESETERERELSQGCIPESYCRKRRFGWANSRRRRLSPWKGAQLRPRQRPVRASAKSTHPSSSVRYTHRQVNEHNKVSSKLQGGIGFEIQCGMGFEIQGGMGLLFGHCFYNRWFLISLCAHME